MDFDARLLNVVLSSIIFGFALGGVVIMRRSVKYQQRGRYGLYGLMCITLAGLMSAIAGGYLQGGDWEEFARMFNFALRSAAIIFLLTHVIYNVQKMKRERDI